MAKLSPVRESVPFLPGLALYSRGKVRDTYYVGEKRLLQYATDGISIFDFVLNAAIPQKGQVLTALNHFWLTKLEQYGVSTHLIAGGLQIDGYLSELLRGNPDLQSRVLVVKELRMIPVEFIARGFLTGSGLKSYNEDGSVCGHPLPPNLQDGDEIPLLDTPTTKAVEGHDEHVDAGKIRSEYPEAVYLLFRVFLTGAMPSRERGIFLADTKIECGRDLDGLLRVGDEALTPDSSRYWSKIEWQESRKSGTRKAPTSYDKQYVRAWGITMGINGLDPKNPEHVARVHQMEVPPEVIRMTTQIYRYIFWRLTDQTLEQYFLRELEVPLPINDKKIVLIVGSASDLDYVRSAMEILGSADRVKPHGMNLHVISCHRNPYDIINFVAQGCGKADAVIAAGGKAFALPGMLDAFIHASGLNIPVVGVALGSPPSSSFEAARLSIEELPGQPVIMDEISGEVYGGVRGLVSAVERVFSRELPPPKPRQEKPAQMNLDLLSFFLSDTYLTCGRL